MFSINFLGLMRLGSPKQQQQSHQADFLLFKPETKGLSQRSALLCICEEWENPHK